MNAGGVPLVEVVMESDNPPPPSFRIGMDEDWMVEWRRCKDDDPEWPVIQSDVSTDPFPFLMSTRNGWYIEPDPLHSLARRLIPPTASILILTLLIHTMEPGLVNIGVLSEAIAGSYRIGPLDYPKLLLVALPIFLLPIVSRMVANLRDIRRQNAYIASPLDSPEISLANEGNGIRIVRLVMPLEVMASRARIQVGIAVPERSKVLEALSRDEGGQPAPGMSTQLPERRITTGEELGTGVGEATPMPIVHPRVLLLEPMRVREAGEWVDFKGGETSYYLKGPGDLWPGSIYSAIIAVHWELVIEAIRDDGTKMKWVRPLKMPPREGLEHIPTLPVRSGRTELST